MESVVTNKHSIRYEDVQVGMKIEVVAKGLYGNNDAGLTSGGA